MKAGTVITEDRDLKKILKYIWKRCVGNFFSFCGKLKIIQFIKVLFFTNSLSIKVVVGSQLQTCADIFRSKGDQGLKVGSLGVGLLFEVGGGF